MYLFVWLFSRDDGQLNNSPGIRMVSTAAAKFTDMTVQNTIYYIGTLWPYAPMADSTTVDVSSVFESSVLDRCQCYINIL